MEGRRATGGPFNARTESEIGVPVQIDVWPVLDLTRQGTAG